SESLIRRALFGNPIPATVDELRLQIRETLIIQSFGGQHRKDIAYPPIIENSEIKNLWKHRGLASEDLLMSTLQKETLDAALKRLDERDFALCNFLNI
ncbi:hypothetical protein OV760_29590, partial [Salmonella enterica subsp. enterica serovar 1,4,[5],12:i:-]|nr:hypothetical protein [Salmonella enterica subsp. enterica serovar 1,4,[5],12:i:-]